MPLKIEGATLVTDEWRSYLTWVDLDDFAGNPAIADFISMELSSDGRFLIAAYGDFSEQLVWDSICEPAYRDVTPEVPHEAP